MRAALIVSTYNQPRHLQRCLQALNHQIHQDFEVIIADDGSRPETAEVIDASAQSASYPIRHVWHPDDGFRKTLILNRAILTTTAPYLVFTDGDCLAHPGYLSEHVKAAKTGSYLNGAIIRDANTIYGLIFIILLLCSRLRWQ